jgi:serine/threonine protein kinase
MTISATGVACVPLEPGRQLRSGYRVEWLVARGDLYDVYGVWSDSRDCLCVAKTLRPDRADDNGARERLVAEGRLARQLVHPNLVRGYETYDDDALPVVILEALGGETLSHLIERRRQGLAAPDLVELGRQLCSVTGYLHRQGWLHLDLKSSNIIAEAGRARLIDLSHVRRPGPCPAGFGTAQYMAPEQILGDEAGPASDVYGLGAVLYRMATRHRPFGRHERDAYPMRQVRLAPLRRRQMPSGLTDLITRCLHVDPAARPSLVEVADVLDKLRSSRAR